jgi:hypothetical protein
MDNSVRAPLVVNYGAGVDSTAMLIGLHERGEVPDLIIFADTGSEKPETYAYLDIMDAKLAEWGWPSITRVKNTPQAGYTSLETNCTVNETLPSLAFGYKSCSLKWKAEPMDRWLLGVKRGHNKCAGWKPVLDALAAGLKPTKCIGYDAGKADSRRAVNRNEDDHFLYRYPLREWGWVREDCIRRIIAEGMPVPVKSACFMCPASKPWELLVLAAKHPDMFLRAIKLEDNARSGKHGLGTVQGLWRKQGWRAWAEREGILAGDAIVMDVAELERRALAAKPALERACWLPCM